MSGSRQELGERRAGQLDVRRRGPEHRWLWGLLVLVLVMLAVVTLRLGRKARLLGETQEATGAVAGLADYGAAPDFALVSQTGDSVRLADMRGWIWIADFIFTRCGSSCPMMSARMEKLASEFEPGWRVRLVSISVDPEHDTPGRLAEYADAYAAEPGRWLFLTGDKQQIRRLVKEGFKLAVEDASPEDVARGAEAVVHSTRFVLVDALGVIRGYYNGLDDEALRQLHHDLQRLGTVPGS